MNQKSYISKELFITKAKDIIRAEGLDTLTMRKLAKESNVAIGTLYNYFPSKVELLKHIIYDFWLHSFFAEIKRIETRSFLDFCIQTHKILSSRNEEFVTLYQTQLPEITKSITEADNEHARQQVEKFFGYCETVMLKDPNINHAHFTKTFTTAYATKFLVERIFTMIVQKETDTSAFEHIIRTLLYL